MKRQQEIKGTERPEQDPDIENALYAWFDAQDEQKHARQTTQTRHASLLLLVKESGREFYPYLDPKTGKKRRIRVKETPKIVSERDVWRRRDADAEVGEEMTAPNDDTPAVDKVVEMKRVKRSSIEKEIDPFAATRAAISDDQDHASSAELDKIGGSYIGGVNSDNEKPKKKGKRKS